MVILSDNNQRWTVWYATKLARLYLPHTGLLFHNLKDTVYAAIMTNRGLWCLCVGILKYANVQGLWPCFIWQWIFRELPDKKVRE